MFESFSGMRLATALRGGEQLLAPAIVGGDNLTFSLEGINLTDEYVDRYVDALDRVSDYRHTGREIAVGLRWKY